MGRKPTKKTLRERARNMTVADLSKLNDRMIAFANAYIDNGGNASAAAKAAGYAVIGANVHGCRLLRNPIIASYIADLQGRVGAIAGMDRAYLLVSLRREYESASMGDLVRGFDGQPVVVNLSTPGAVAFTPPPVKGSTVPQETVYHLRKPDRVAALRGLELIGRTLGLLNSSPTASTGEGVPGAKGAPVEGSDMSKDAFALVLEAARGGQGQEKAAGKGGGAPMSKAHTDLATVVPKGEG